MPTPRKDETRKEYVSRCIPVVMREGTAKSSEQAAAICHSMFDRRGKGHLKIKSKKPLKE